MKHHIFYTAVLLAVVASIIFSKGTKIPVMAKGTVGSLASGKWGTCSWEIYNDGSLVIEQGTGEGQPLGATSGPWSTYASQIKSINFSGKVIAPSNCCSLFRSLSNAAEITNAEDFDTGNVTNMYEMFYNCSALTTLDVSGWNTGNVKGMSDMFDNCRALTSLDVSGWNTGNVTDMSGMFSGCSKLTSLDASGWNTSKVTSMLSMFEGCNKLTSLNVSGWDTGKVTDMRAVFDDCKSLTALDLSGWDTGKVTYMGEMFYGCSALTSLDVSGWDTSNVTSMYRMFSFCNALTSLDVSGWNTGNVTNMSGMFSSCIGLTTLNASGWNTSNVTNMNKMFYNCKALTSLDVSGWNTGNVTDMSHVFDGCRALTSLDVSGWDTSNVTSMYRMFSFCNALTTLDASGWNTGNVTDMSYMFSSCIGLTTLNASGWNTGKVTNMRYMFYGCSKLTSLDISGWNMSNVTDMNNMFQGCISLTTLDVSGWNIGKVTNMNKMFYNCKALTTLDASGWDTSKVTDMKDMLYGCSALNTISFGTKWTKVLSDEVSFPATTDWIKKQDADGTKLADKTEYTLANSNDAWVVTLPADYLIENQIDETVLDNMVSQGTFISAVMNDDGSATVVINDAVYEQIRNSLPQGNSSIVVPSTTDPSKTTALAGVWRRASADYYEDLGDGDIRYDSQDVIAGDSDTDTGNKWVKQGNTWVYRFKVFDDTKTYYLTEDDIDGYTKQFASTGTSDYGIINQTGNITKSDTVTNTSSSDGTLVINKAIATGDGSAVSDNQKNIKFPFIITLTDSNGNKLSGSLVLGTTVFKDGIAHVSASVNSPVSIPKIPVGYGYKVEEEDTAGYTEPSPQTGTIAEGTRALTFTNTKETVKTGSYCTLTVSKNITGRYGGTAPSDSYSFTADFSGLKAGTAYSMSDGTTFTATALGTASVPFSLSAGKSITFSVPAETKYVVTESAGNYTPSFTISGSDSIAQETEAGSGENESLATAEETLSKGETNTVSFTNDIEMKQTLTIRKFTGTGDETKTDSFDFTADTGAAIPDTKFNFTIVFYNLRESDSFTSDIGRIKAQEPADADDVALGADKNTYTAKKDFTLKSGESISFNDIPVGVKYIVTEKETPCTVQCIVSGTDVETGKTGTDTVTEGSVVTSYSKNTHPTAMETVDYGENGVVTFNNRRADTAALQIIKKGFGGERLDGAVFVVCDLDGNVKTYADGNTMTLTSESSGYTNIVNGLTAGTYIIKETKVPDGYTAMEPYTLQVTNKDFGTTITLTFVNSRLIELPSAGGRGTILLTVISALAAAVFLALIIKHRVQAGR